VLIRTVHKGGPAEKAGLKADDIIIAMNGKPVKNGDDLVARVSETPVGSTVAVTVDRDSKRMDFNLTVLDRAEVFKDDSRFAALREESEPEASVNPGKSDEPRQYKFGVKLHALTDTERSTMGLDAKGGLLVQGVDADSFAEDIGLTEKDVILSINRQPVESVDDVRKIQGMLKPGDAVAFHIMRPTAGGRGHAPQWVSTFVSGALPKE
jgi:serine protease Do